MGTSRAVLQLVEDPTEKGLSGCWGRNSKLEKTLIIVSVVLLLSCAALVVVVVWISKSATAPPWAAPAESHFDKDQYDGSDKYKHNELGQKISHEPSKVPEIPTNKSAKSSTYVGQGANGEIYDICNTEECILAAATIIEAMDESVNPCENFYQFACGGWMVKNPVPESYSSWSQFEVLGRELSKAMSAILSVSLNNNDPEPINQVKTLYNACMNLTQLETLGVAPLTDFLAQYGGWPMALENWKRNSFDWRKSVADARRSMGSEYLIGVSVYADQKDNDATAIYIDQTSLGMHRSILANPENYGERLAAYKTYMASAASIIAASLGQKVDGTTIYIDVSATIDFEIALANITTPGEERRDFERMYNKMSVSELSSLTAGSSVNWKEMLNIMFSTAGITIDDSTQVIVNEVEFLKKLATLLDTTCSRTLANYLMWRHVQSLGVYTNEAMRNASFQFQKAISGISALAPRSELCADTANYYMGDALGIRYVESHFSQQAKDEVDTMAEDIRAVFKDMLGVNDWMDDETKPKAVEKANTIIKFIGYPDWYSNNTALEHYYGGLENLFDDTYFHNIRALRLWMSTDELNDFGLPTDKTKWFTPPAIVNAFYSAEINSIVFPAGILQPPYYRANSLKALNYGGIGHAIGHEITHGFDDQGRQYNKDGNILPWWSNATLDAFKEKAQCIVHQYGNISISEVGELMLNATINGVNTQGENIADNGGLREAFLAYQKYVERNGEEPRLPGIDQFTPYQLFFLANANIWCGTITKEELVNTLLDDPHSPTQYRVLLPMSNMEKFSAVWNCPSTAQMNPSNKCVVW